MPVLKVFSQAKKLKRITQKHIPLYKSVVLNSGCKPGINWGKLKNKKPPRHEPYPDKLNQNI